MANKPASLTEIINETVHHTGEFSRGFGAGLCYLYAIPTGLRVLESCKKEPGQQTRALGYFSGGILSSGVGLVVVAQLSMSGTTVADGSPLFAVQILIVAGNAISGLYEIVKYAKYKAKER